MAWCDYEAWFGEYIPWLEVTHVARRDWYCGGGGVVKHQESLLVSLEFGLRTLTLCTGSLAGGPLCARLSFARIQVLAYTPHVMSPERQATRGPPHLGPSPPIAASPPSQAQLACVLAVEPGFQFQPIIPFSLVANPA